MKQSRIVFLLMLSLLFACEDGWDLERTEFLQVTMESPKVISFNTVELKAKITDLVEKPVTEHGFIWSRVTSLPTTSDFEGLTSLGVKQENGEFTRQVDGLSFGTTYFFRAYAIADDKVFYSDHQEFTSKSGSAITLDYNYEGGRSLTLNGGLSNLLPGLETIEHGFVWSFENEQPTLNDNAIRLGNLNTQTTFSFKLDTTIEKGSLFHFGTFGIIKGDAILDTVYSPSFLTFDGGEMYDIWETITNVGVGLKSNASAFSINGKGYVTTGSSNQQDNCTDHLGLNACLREYNPMSDSWTLKTAFPGAPRASTSAFVIDGRAYVGGGQRSNIILNDYYSYDPVNDQWDAISSPPEEHRVRSGASFSLNGRGYIVGGISPQGIVNTVLEYDPIGDNWRVMDEGIPGNRHSAVALVIGDKAYIGLGLYSGHKSDFWAYDPLTESWEQKESFPNGGRLGAVGIGINGKAYVGTGNGPGTFTGNFQWADFWEYDPAKDQWDKKDNIQSRSSNGDIQTFYLTNAVSFLIGKDIYVGTGEHFFKFITQ